MGILEKFFGTNKKAKAEGFDRSERAADEVLREPAEKPSAPESGEAEPKPEETLPDMEKEEELPFHIDTAADFIRLLELRFKEAQESKNNENEKDLFYQIIKIKNGLNTAGLSADEVRVREMQPGVLGTFDPGNREIAGAKAMFDDFGSDERLFRTVFLHEATHRDRIADEGFCELSVEMKIDAVPGIYNTEKQKAKKTFNDLLGMSDAIELYNIDEPEKLAESYIAAKLEKELGVRKAQEILADKKKLGNSINKLKTEVGDNLEKGAPRLYEKLKSRGFDFKKKITAALDKMGK
ncbi:hypothetical protein A2468_03090 [Candidatus Falkowbacteria bacterium RIFOXYC2_FULL_46_15]|uniref:Uncharacterized protein n=1 Tax=Candidatus Falkowbacteria bacterium RIFOXYA2_FULL_47_19 TaxID=1797994 RepID=A0A1F5SIR9_9BACT|nr:MAG: hypothetical protein A2227_03675 [Candidatus Falkowbacteria bacterium RIFOXYA2_FULL_47_19]OGF35429.1 MAG: hypothetical protein A2468_03090 [Candidatus Falkowbacteria bacterium RIFOXYC2_FULL_46_15]